VNDSVQGLLIRSKSVWRVRFRRAATVLALVLIAAAVWLNTLHRRSQRCQHNVGLLTTAVENYNQEHRQPPVHLRQLVPRYLAAVPVCPVAGEDTYSAAYFTDGYVYCEYRSRSEKLNWQFFHE
jgi:hypothetical protein